MVRTWAALVGLVCSVLAAPGVVPAPPDLLYFTERVAPILQARCAGCHSDPEMAGSYLLTPPRDRAATLANFRATLAHLDPDAPAAGAVLRKARGELKHGGGALLAETDPDHGRLLQFALGATLRNRAPEAIAQRRYDVDAGAVIALDGTLSGDPDGDALAYDWTVRERPAGSTAAVAAGTDEGTASFTPDRAGVYRLELRVHDGKLASLPFAVLVVSRAAPPAAAAEAPAKKLLDRRLDERQLRLVRRLYLDLVGRTPTLAEVERWYGVPHAEIVSALLQEEEVWANWYENQLFFFLLLDRFRPKEGRLTTIPARINSGELSLEGALAEIVRSQYFNARNPGNDTFVTVVLEQCLGIVVQERKGKRLLDLGKKMYDGYKTKLFRESGDSQADFVRICFRQDVFHRHLAARAYADVFGEPPAKRDLDAAVARLVSGEVELKTLLQEWISGDAYLASVATARTKPEIPYVRGLFLDALGRVPTYEELRNVRNAFLSLADPTPVRLVLGRVLLDSPQMRLPESAGDPERFVREQFVRLFARPATDKEVEAFVDALRNDPRVTPRVVLWALLSSPEYQSY